MTRFERYSKANPTLTGLEILAIIEKEDEAIRAEKEMEAKAKKDFNVRLFMGGVYFINSDEQNDRLTLYHVLRPHENNEMTHLETDSIRMDYHRDGEISRVILETSGIDIRTFSKPYMKEIKRDEYENILSKVQGVETSFKTILKRYF